VKRNGLPIAVIAAAGRARRFNGEQKVLADVGGMPAVCRVVKACEEGLGPQRQIVVVGHMAEQVRAALGEAAHREFVHQYPQLGTGHALAVALANLNGAHSGELYFFCGDKSFLTAESVRHLRARLRTSGAAMVFLTSEVAGDPSESRQGRVVQAYRGSPRAEVLAIIERSVIEALDSRKLTFESFSGELCEYTRDQLLGIRDVNVSAYGWRLEALREHVGELWQHPEKGEYFVTDLVQILRRHRYLVRAFPIANGHESIGIDSHDLLERAKEAWAELRETTRRAGHSGNGGALLRVRKV